MASRRSYGAEVQLGLSRLDRLSKLVVLQIGDVPNVGMLPKPAAYLRLGSGHYQSEKAVFTGNQPNRACPGGAEQRLSLPHGDTLLKEHGDTTRAQEWRLLATARSLELLHERAGGRLGLSMQ